MNTIRTYTFFLLLATVLFAGCNDNGSGSTKKMPDLSETFSNKDTKPFGTYIAYQQLEQMFYRNTIRDEKKNFEDSWKYVDDTGCVYICMAHSLYTTDEDVDGLMSYVRNGNDVFFAAAQFDSNLTSRLGCATVNDLDLAALISNKPYRSTDVKLKAGGKADAGSYEYFYLPFLNKFSSFDSSKTRVLGVNESGDPDFIVIFEGKGRIFLHCDPRAFSNYFLLQKDNYEYFQKAFGYLKSYPDHVYWNNYYPRLRSREQAERKRNSSSDPESFNSLREILSHPPLAIAFWLTLILLVLYILFGMKRRQRIIDIIKPNENTTVTFTETIGRLYLQKKDNKNIADKMVTYFNEYIRNNYFLNTNQVNKDFMSTLSRKSGVPFEKVETLYRAIDHAHRNPDIDDYQLLSLNEQIQNFYKTRN